MTVQMAYCPGCDARVEVAEGRCWPSGHLVGHAVYRDPRCACGWRLDGARVCPACGTTNENKRSAA